MAIHGTLLDDFLSPVLDCGELTSSESAELQKCAGEVNSWFAAINGDVESASLSQYAAAIAGAGGQSDSTVCEVRGLRRHSVREIRFAAGDDRFEWGRICGSWGKVKNQGVATAAQ